MKYIIVRELLTQNSYQKLSKLGWTKLRLGVVLKTFSFKYLGPDTLVHKLHHTSITFLFINSGI